ncbi:hypothetical protein AVEN_110696-1 [Araneus ventricosus]|uniref:Uncharacterized protein n=1 Tax=Araneus ventricosus TaxID=182803 RepID=A0A4Y2ATP8_ARAVE|nr:hypothetical protein AVEN_110696-1 [Araneus ventricosus]
MHLRGPCKPPSVKIGKNQRNRDWNSELTSIYYDVLHVVNKYLIHFITLLVIEYVVTHGLGRVITSMTLRLLEGAEDSHFSISKYRVVLGLIRRLLPRLSESLCLSIRSDMSVNFI